MLSIVAKHTWSFCHFPYNKAKKIIFYYPVTFHNIPQ
jgi:hypothetical protein